MDSGLIRLVAVAVVVGMVLVAIPACSRFGGSDEGVAPGQTAPLSPEAEASGINAGVDPVGTTTDGQLTVDGRTRTYHLYVPSSLAPDTPTPLLVALHGGLGWGTQFEANSGFDRLAEANGFVVVYPDGFGVGRDNDRLRTWNAGMCCGPAMNNGVDDVAFVSQLIDEISATRSIDPARVFATGHSNGAMTSYRLACELSDKIVAAAVVAGTLAVQPCTPSHPVSFMEIHGTGDKNVPIDGGKGDRSLVQADYPSPRVGIATMASLAGCTGEPTITTAGDLTTTSWSPCDAKTEVKLVAIAGAVHAWPGSAPTRVRVAGTPYPGYDASREVWAFLSTHPRQPPEPA